MYAINMFQQFTLPALLVCLCVGSISLTGCATGRYNLPTVPHIDLHRYAGKWYEVARLPVFYQGDGERAIAEYSLKSDGTLAILNTSISWDGSRRSISGTATPVPGSGNARLRVRINAFPAKLLPIPRDGNYWIIDVAPDYRYALVGTPDRRFLWLLSRTPSIDQSDFTRMRELADSLGFVTDSLVIHRG